MLIESTQNAKIKHLSRLLTDNRFRKKTGTFVVEGRQENARAAEHGFEVLEYFICEELFEGDFPKGKITLVSKNVYGKIAYRGSTEGIMGVFALKTKTLNEFKPKTDSSLIIVESVEKPGNLGAILRSCEAFGIDALVITDAKTDFYNPNVIRSSVGCLFGMNIFQCENAELEEFLQSKEYSVFTTFMDDAAVALPQVQLNHRTAIAFGTEHSGLTEFWRGVGNNITVPMAGTIDSLNLSNAVAIICYEILRQKLK